MAFLEGDSVVCAILHDFEFKGLFPMYTMLNYSICAKQHGKMCMFKDKLKLSVTFTE